MLKEWIREFVAVGGEINERVVVGKGNGVECISRKSFQKSSKVELQGPRTSERSVH